MTLRFIVKHYFMDPSCQDSPTFDDAALDELVCRIAGDLEAGRSVNIAELAHGSASLEDRLRRLLPALEAVVGLGSSRASVQPPSPATSTAEFLPFEANDGSPDRGLIGDFRIVREIGRGGMGVVYEAEQISLGRRVALKVLPFAAMLDELQLKRFKNEARAAATLHHPHIVPVHSVGCERGVHYYAMQLIEGSSLAEIIHQLGVTNGIQAGGAPAAEWPLSSAPSVPSPAPHTVLSPPDGPTSRASDAADTKRDPQAALSTIPHADSRDYFRTAARLGAEAAEALAHAHQQGIVHRDVKPANLMVDGGGKLWVADFGLAQMEASAGLTLTGDLLGTLRYMSPEQASGHGVVDHRTDVYSLGVTLYELVTRTPAYTEADRKKLFRQIACDNPRSPRQINARIPSDIDTIVAKAMEKDAADRYATAQELAADLRRFLADEPIRARPPSLWHNVNKWTRRHRGLAWAGTIMLLVTTVGLGVTALLIKRSRDVALAANTVAVAERERAELNLQLALEAIDALYTQFSGDRLALEPKLTPVRREFLQQALEFYRRFAEQNRQQPSNWPEVGRLYGRIGRIHEDLGEIGPALLSYYEEVEILRHLQQGAPESLSDALNLTEAMAHAAHVALAAGMLPPATQLYAEGIRLLESFGKPFDSTVSSDNSQRERALAAYYSAIGRAYGQSHASKDAAEALRRSIAIHRRLPELYPADFETLHAMGDALHDFALIRRNEPDTADMEGLLEEAVALGQRADALAPAHPDQRRFLRNHHLLVGDMLAEAGKLNQAVNEYRASCDLATTLAQEYADLAEDQDIATRVKFSWGCAVFALGDVAASAELFAQCTSNGRELSALATVDPHRSMLQATAQLGLSLALREAASPSAATQLATGVAQVRDLCDGGGERWFRAAEEANYAKALVDATLLVDKAHQMPAENAIDEASLRQREAETAIARLRESIEIHGLEDVILQYLRLLETDLDRLGDQIVNRPSLEIAPHDEQ